MKELVWEIVYDFWRQVRVGDLVNNHQIAYEPQPYLVTAVGEEYFLARGRRGMDPERVLKITGEWPGSGYQWEVQRERTWS